MVKQFKKYLQTHRYPNFDLRAVLFDMDGVLYDSMPNHACSWQQTMEEFGFKTTKPENLFARRATVKFTINIIFKENWGAMLLMRK